MNKHKLHRQAQDLLYDGFGGLPDNRAGSKSFYCCGRGHIPHVSAVSLNVQVVDDKVKSVGFGGLTSCHNSLLCPVCSLERSLQDRQRLDSIVAGAISQGLVCVPVAMTVPHSTEDSLPDLLRRLRSFRNSFYGRGRPRAAFLRRYGIVGQIQAFELTLSVKDFKGYNKAWSDFVNTDDYKSELVSVKADYLAYVNRFVESSIVAMDRDSFVSAPSSTVDFVSEMLKWRSRYFAAQSADRAELRGHFQQEWEKALSCADIVAVEVVRDRFAWEHFDAITDYHPHYHSLWIMDQASYERLRAEIPLLKARWRDIVVAAVPTADPEVVFKRGLVIGSPVEDSEYITKCGWGATSELTAKDDKSTKAFWKMTPLRMLAKYNRTPLIRAVWNNLVNSLRGVRRLTCSKDIDRFARSDIMTSDLESVTAAFIPFDTFAELRSRDLLDGLIEFVKQSTFEVAQVSISYFIVTNCPNAPPPYFP